RQSPCSPCDSVNGLSAKYARAHFNLKTNVRTNGKSFTRLACEYLRDHCNGYTAAGNYFLKERL
ncbi:MAG: hypothetical protein IJ074_09470, partial [Clostridia bacterium]|nr:hypothetical protein [Clostridia bacterium]